MAEGAAWAAVAALWLAQRSQGQGFDLNQRTMVLLGEVSLYDCPPVCCSFNTNKDVEIQKDKKQEASRTVILPLMK